MKKKPMTIVALRRSLTEADVEIHDEPPEPYMRLRVSIGRERKGLPGGSFYVRMRDADENAFLDMNLVVSVPKHRVVEALKLLRRLHELR
jgi:hypothetical protein